MNCTASAQKYCKPHEDFIADPRSVKNCPWVGPILGLVMRNNDLKIFENVSPDTCKQKCRDEVTFHCKSFDYNQKNKKCYLQSVNRDDRALESFRDVEYYEMSCKGKIR